MTEAEEAAVRFNTMINAGDAGGLARQMSDDHRFHPDLAGPALWTARVDGGLVTEWRVYDDTPETWEALGVAQ